jgi:hypothetical protein
MERVRYLYKTTCLVTGKYYIGMHSTNRPNLKYYGSGILLRRSLKKHGRDQHVIEIVEYCDSDEQLRAREREWITATVRNDDMCMNLMDGGQGGFTDDARMKAHAVQREKLKDPAYRLIVSERNRIKRLRQVEKDPSCATKHHNALRERYKDPIFKQKQVATAKQRYQLMRQLRQQKLDAGWKLLTDPSNNKRRKLFPPEQIEQKLKENWRVGTC